MRSGHLLAEESPSVLLNIYKCASLEEVFLKLSRIQSQKLTDATPVNFRSVSTIYILNLIDSVKLHIS